MGVIEVHDLIFKYQDHLVFNKLNLNIKKGSFTTIIGNNGSGKSTLVKLLLGFEKSEGIYAFDKPVEDNLWYIRRNIGVIFENPAEMFIENTLEKEMVLSLKHLSLDKDTLQKKILTVTKELDIENLLTMDPHFLNKEQQYLAAFAICLVTEPKIIIIDDALSTLSNDRVIKLLKKINKKGTTIINLTTDAEEILYGDNIIFIKDHKNIFSGTKAKLLKNLDVFKEYKIEMPFIIDLSDKLMFYNLLDKRYTNMGTLVNSIWKN